MNQKFLSTIRIIVLPAILALGFTAEFAEAGKANLFQKIHQHLDPGLDYS